MTNPDIDFYVMQYLEKSCAPQDEFRNICCHSKRSKTTLNIINQQKKPFLVALNRVLKSIFETIIPLTTQYLIILLYGDALIKLLYTGTLMYTA